MSNNYNPDASPADNARLNSVAVIFDTSVLLYLVMDEIGLKNKCEFMSAVREFIKGKKQLILKEVASQIEIEIKRRESMGKIRGEHGGKLKMESIQDMITEILSEKYERIDVQGWEDYFEMIRHILKKLIEKPNHSMSWEWLKMKRKFLLKQGIDVNQLRTAGKKMEALRILEKEMLRGRDIKILAKAMKASKTRKIHFVSNDGDHVFLGKSAKALTEGRLRVYRPKGKGILQIT